MNRELGGDREGSEEPVREQEKIVKESNREGKGSGIGSGGCRKGKDVLW